MWGTDPSVVTRHLGDEHTLSSKRFSLLLLSDLVFNHQAHPAILKTLSETLDQRASVPSAPCSPAASSDSRSAVPSSEDLSDAGLSTCPQLPCALVFFSHHRPQFADKDMQFFESARSHGWATEEVGRWKMPVSSHEICAHFCARLTIWVTLDARVAADV